MTAAYGKDLRASVIRYYEEGSHTQVEVSEILGIHISTFKRIYKHYRETGQVELPKNKAGRPSLISESGYEQIKQWVQSKPTLLLEEIQKRYDEENQIKLSLSTICRALKQLSLNRKKISHYAQEQEREDVKKKKKLPQRKCKNKC